MKKYLIIFIMLCVISVPLHAWQNQPPVVTSFASKSVSPVELSVTAKGLGSNNNPLWTRSTIVDGNGRTVTAFGGIPTQLLAADAISGNTVAVTAQSVSASVKALDVGIASIGGSLVTNANYVTPVAGVNTTITAVALHGLPDVIAYGITNTAQILADGYTNGAGINVTITASGTIEIIDYRHSEQHEGYSFEIGNTLSAITTSAPRYIGMYVPNGVTIHARVVFSSYDGVYITQLFSGNFGAAGNTSTVYAVNKTTAITSNITAYENVNTTTAVAAMPAFNVGANSTNQGSIGDVLQGGSDDYAILGAGSWFFRLTAVTNNVLGSWAVQYYTE